ncbi:MAG: amidohydrolase family protein [Vicinamibacterales bacterium]
MRDVLIRGNNIAAVGADLHLAEPGIEVLDARGMLVVPGFVNAHYHSHDVLARGMLEDLALEHWGTLAGPLASKRSLAEVRARTLVGALECLHNGITTVQDMTSFSPMSEEVLDTILDAYAEAGLRVILSVTVRDLSQLETIPWVRELAPAELHDAIGTQRDPAGPQLEFIARQIERIGDRDGMVRWALSPSAPQRCTPALLEGVAALSEAHDLPIYTHVYETRTQRIFARDHLADYGGSAVRYMQATRVIGPRVTIAHGVWPEQDEIDLIGATGTSVVVNMLSNLKLKSGVAPILAYRERGVNLALGCDNCSCSDVQSMLQVMKLFCLLSAVSSPYTTGVTAAEALRAATVGGARTAGLANVVGAVRPGYRADLVLVDLADPAYVPFNSAVRQLVYSDTGRSIRTVIVDGRVVLRNGATTRVDEASLRDEVDRMMPAVRKDVAGLQAGYQRLRPYLEQVQRRAWSIPMSIHRHIGPAPH